MRLLISHLAGEFLIGHMRYARNKLQTQQRHLRSWEETELQGIYLGMVSFLAGRKAQQILLETCSNMLEKTLFQHLE